MGKNIFVKDLANVRDTIRDVNLDERINGQNGIRMVIMKQTGANTVAIVKKVKKMMTEDIMPGLPPDIKAQIIYDSAQTIQNSIDGLSEAVMLAFVFVALVVMFFLGRWRATLIIRVPL